jgi:membrane peptidoglycan carboxypeptidase
MTLDADSGAMTNSSRKAKLFVFLAVFVLIFSSGMAARYELRTSSVQSWLLADFAKSLAFEIQPGPSPLIRFPGDGPYDLRYGYTLLPRFVDNLLAKDFKIVSQASISEQHAKLIDQGIFPIYRAKTQAGLKILDDDNNPVLLYRTPEVVFLNFESIPKILVDTLLFIEDRNLLDPNRPHHNPAIEWDRFAKAVIDLILSRVDDDRHVPGGSTLATQIEKFRHSPEGRTGKPAEKLRQMASAALRAYLDGEDTMRTRQQIVLDYINSVPLAAVPGYGEVNGLGDGLWAYYGRDLNDINHLLTSEYDRSNPAQLARQAVAYWQVLSLFLAHRRPSDYLGDNPKPLREQISRYLPVLYSYGIIPDALYETATKANSRAHRALPPVEKVSFTERKGLNLIRTYLLTSLGLNSLYDLDRLDLTVKSALDDNTQREVTKILNKLRETDYVRSIGLEGFRMLDSRGDPGKIIYSFTLWERGEKENYLRVQTDNYDQPFDINAGVKLDLGSTAKLRTLITYLEIIEALHKDFAQADAKTLAAAVKSNPDPITTWALNYLSGAKDKSLVPMLQGAMSRQYSANPGETFFTAGGLHTFKNFKEEDNGRVVPVREAVRHSINLPFIRLMRDIVRYYGLHTFGSTARALKEMKDVARTEYLRRFADQEGQVFLTQFYNKYAGKSPE